VSARIEIGALLDRVHATDDALRVWQAEERAMAAARWAALEPLLTELRELAVIAAAQRDLEVLKQAAAQREGGAT